ncbi:hypothetical protein [Streptomyces zagrosensis]|uniref:Uncharacterized protein n=1 Tax=Streptomyces zagrosensis TaxID=1042984 RepID=A0A7W9QBK2_9ACTN|nr:hypothetical protein [Streptomyces zagrosensis]MBB5937160.1 hypothetical protein [Streptomyces zagrosensis]
MKSPAGSENGLSEEECPHQAVMAAAGPSLLGRQRDVIGSTALSKGPIVTDGCGRTL